MGALRHKQQQLYIQNVATVLDGPGGASLQNWGAFEMYAVFLLLCLCCFTVEVVYPLSSNN
jgi:hypothetical protein